MRRLSRKGNGTEMAKKQFRHLRLLVPDAYDCILSKVERNADLDVNDAEYLFRSQKLDAQVLRNRYEKEFRWYIDTLVSSSFSFSS
jgi:hypothetical protein